MCVSRWFSSCQRSLFLHSLRSSFDFLWRLGLSAAAPEDLRDEAKTVGLVPLGGPLILLLSAISQISWSARQFQTRRLNDEKEQSKETRGRRKEVQQRIDAKVQKRKSAVLRAVCTVCLPGRWVFFLPFIRFFSLHFFFFFLFSFFPQQSLGFLSPVPL